MTTLSHFLLDENQRDSVVRDCVSLIERQIDSSGLIRRTTLKAGVAVLQKIRPDALYRAVNGLLPAFAAELEPMYASFHEGDSTDFGAFLADQPELTTNALLRVSDRQAGNSQKAAIRTAYARLRPIAEAEVRSGIPDIAHIIGRCVPQK